ncbi:phage terminase large subunit [Subdoligranulum variabile]|uniref:phage terminase large subunit n=1 Tax=Subdoligranulum variabile TaxID=214851 RepID=UPI0026F1E20E|nr:phage terminase large subunit [Subdoligranulum variabile]
MHGVTLKIEPPNPKQKLFFAAREKYIGYGGARGGGKSWAMRRKSVLLALRYPGIRVLILRRTYPELTETYVKPMRGELAELIRAKQVRYKETSKEFEFSNGSLLMLGYCDTDADIDRYQGAQYDVIFIDEATQWPEDWYLILTACLRGVNDLPKRMYLTCNPGGVGHNWVKRLFIDREYMANENPEDYRFIQALVYENTALMEKNPDYLRQLQNLPEKLRKGWLEGEWDLFDGQYFAEFRREKHVIQPFELPARWRRYVTMDYGLDMLAAYWIAVDEEGKGYVYRELYEGRDNGKGADGRGHIVSAAARRVREYMPPGERIEAWLAPPDLWNRNRDSGRSTAELFAEAGMVLTKTSNDRIAGWRAVREWLADVVDEHGKTVPRLRIFSTCTNLIRTLPAVQFDEKRPEDVATEPHELTHAPDALRGFCVYRSSPADPPPPEKMCGVEVFYDRSLQSSADEILGLGEDIYVV